MKIALNNITVLDPESPYHLQKKNILVEEGRYAKITDEALEGDITKNCDGAFISAGWFDPFVDFADPGYEHREGLDHGIQVASASGFTSLGLMSETAPRIENKSIQNYIQKFNLYSATKLFAVPALTHKEEGAYQMTELFDLHQNGALTFYDTEKNPSDELLLRVLLYVKNFGGKVTICSMDHRLNPVGVISEGKASVLTGLKNLPEISDTLNISRAIELLRYTDSKLHVTGIASNAALEQIKEAKKEGLSITCDVHLANLLYNEMDLLDFDENKKVFPPLRTEEDQKALIKGVKDGAIDFVTSFHQPRDEEDKNVEFDQSSYGISSLEVIFPKLTEIFGLETAVALLGKRSKDAFGVPISHISEGQTAVATLFNESTWTYDSPVSKGFNNPFKGEELTGKALGIINEENFRV